MKKKIHLIIIITHKDLAVYYKYKNIDSATLLLKLYTVCHSSDMWVLKVLLVLVLGKESVALNQVLWLKWRS